MIDERLNYNLISKYRKILMGIAIIFIMFCHLDVAQTHNEIPSTGVARALHIFTVGVDIFLLLSGVGLYYSYTKKRLPYWDFEKKRLLRILPCYLSIGGITYILYDIILNNFNAQKMFSDLVFITWFKEGNTRYWYIFTIIIFYLLFPAFYKWLFSGSNILVKTTLFCLCWWTAVEIICVIDPNVNYYKLALSRLSVFVIGVYFGKLSYEEKPVSYLELILLLLGGYTCFFILKMPIAKTVSIYLYYPVRALLGLSIVATIIIIMEYLEKHSIRLFLIIEKIIGWCGGVTLELYLLHQSYMIIFEFPYKLSAYFMTAVILPLITAGVIYIGRNIIKEGNAK